MGIVASQSFKNILSTYLGFLVGAINTLFLYVNFMSDTYYGMVGFMLSAAYVMMPLMAFGVHNTIVKFYSSFKTRLSLNSFLTLMLFLPLCIIIPTSIIGYVGYGAIGGFLASENAMIKNYLWHTIIIAGALAYFEVFYAWVKVQFQTVFGNFMKEVFHRVGAMVCLLLLYLKIIDVEQFMVSLVIVYILRMLVMMLYAFSIKLPVLIFKKVNGLTNILKYSFLIIVAGSIATVLLDIDKVMLGKYISIENIAYYNVAVFIATVIAVPQRAMHQILLPLSAKYLNENDMDSLANLYKRSSINLFIVSGLIFLLIILNINQLYTLIAPEYSIGLYIVLLISVAKLYDAILGSNNAILFNSNYYRVVLVLGVILVIVMVLLNVFLIPLYGLHGAAIATFIAMFFYNTAKVVVVYKVFGITPFSANTLKMGVSLTALTLAGYFWDFGFNAIVNILLKSALIVVVFLGIIYRLNFSEEINDLIHKTLRSIKRSK
ncbi:polysaccharide biosynthesis C-terminal domain-containing protein [Jejuia pallidilutea]|uniref:Polysaccharide biosynthesis protein n=2 Tax=Jejuia pallidilutea TaxID=504487 RepID=A0A090WHR3_9FLAO|nr:polysaccharide biosynthesis C-terminal domain-containing protein [Jejuia pallidilutea]GAL67017.1 polysaccharide biosynthesis protein [Jejuia pallidilutea]GAL90596.1 polysaccharide biosynthesis protein [Jejuia pallidilutea]